MSPRTDNRVRRSRLPGILVLAAVLRLALLAAMWPDDARLQRQDSFSSYLPLAKVLAEHGEFAMTPGGGKETLRTPGYPAFLAAIHVVTGGSLWCAALVQVALSVAVAWLAARLGRAVSGDTVGDGAAAVIAVDPVSAIHAATLLSETLFTALFTVTVLFAWKNAECASARAAAAAGVALGLAVLVRPIALYLIPLLVLWLLAAVAGLPRRLAIAALAAGLALAPAFAWMARNQAVGAGFMLSSIEGLNALYYRAGPALARAKGIGWDDANKQLEIELARRAPSGSPTAESMRTARALAMEVLRAHPVAAAQVALEGAVRMWAGPGSGDLMIMFDVAELGSQARWPLRGPLARRVVAGLLAVLAWGVHLAVTLAALYGLAVLGRERRGRALVFTLGILCAYTLLSASPGAYARLRAPVMPVVAVLAAIGFLKTSAAPRDDRHPGPEEAPSADPRIAPPDSAS